MIQPTTGRKGGCAGRHTRSRISLYALSSLPQPAVRNEAKREVITSKPHVWGMANASYHHHYQKKMRVKVGLEILSLWNFSGLRLSW